MSVMDKIAFSLNRRDEVPNQHLAQELIDSNDVKGVQTIADHLWDKNTNIQSDCLKVLYEIGYLKPEMIAPYFQDFLKLLQQNNNRLIWGAMIALATIAKIQADDLYKNYAVIKTAIQNGSVITRDNGVKALAIIASASQDYKEEIFPFLMDHLKTCQPKDVAQRAESISVSVDDLNRNSFLAVLNIRMNDISPAGLTRVKKVIKKLDTLLIKEKPDLSGN